MKKRLGDSIANAEWEGKVVGLGLGLIGWMALEKLVDGCETRSSPGRVNCDTARQKFEILSRNSKSNGNASNHRINGPNSIAFNH
jgi:hypothetical protein